MTNKEKQDWLKDNYPLTIITDRYSGTYSDGYYLAFPLDFDEIPSAVNDSDPECAEFWKDYSEPVGKGSSVQAAIEDLIYKMRNNVIIDVPFGAQDSELKGWEYTIPEGMEAEMKDGKIIVRQKESEDERIRKAIIDALYSHTNSINVLSSRGYSMDDVIAWLEKQKEASKAIEAVERIDKYIDENLANAHDMKDSNPDKKYYRGWDDALGEMARILQDVYSDEKQKEEEEMITVSKEAWDENAKDSFERGIKVGMIRQQKEQKPVEWSEEDEETMQDLIELLWILQGCSNMKPGTASKYTQWLKSLRPSWRPSEEQMSMLLAVIRDPNNAGSESCFLAFKSLYEDLKKLM